MGHAQGKAFGGAAQERLTVQLKASRVRGQ